jgi:hypothetical protein
MVAAVFVGAGLLVFGLVMWAGHRMLVERRGGASSATGGALGNFIDVFDPARARADLDLASKEHQGDVLPSPDDHDLPVRVDLESGRARINRSVPPRRSVPPSRGR